MRNNFIRAVLIFAIFYLGLGAYLTIHQERFIYHPFPQDFRACQGFAEAEKIRHQGTRMYVQLVEDQPTVLLYHGNAGSACDRKFFAEIFSQAGLGYVVVEYAGYSNDAREPSHELIKRDVENAVAYLTENDISPVYIVGESIGTGAASYHTYLKAPERLLLVSPFTDLRAIAKERYWFYPTRILVKNAFDNVTALQNYAGKTMVIHGTADNIIPYKLGLRVFDALGKHKLLASIEGAGHNDLFTFEETYRKINAFLR